jgi:hypothetical protein
MPRMPPKAEARPCVYRSCQNLLIILVPDFSDTSTRRIVQTPSPSLLCSRSPYHLIRRFRYKIKERSVFQLPTSSQLYLGFKPPHIRGNPQAIASPSKSMEHPNVGRYPCQGVIMNNLPLPPRELHHSNSDLSRQSKALGPSTLLQRHDHRLLYSPFTRKPCCLAPNREDTQTFMRNVSENRNFNLSSQMGQRSNTTQASSTIRFLENSTDAE